MDLVAVVMICSVATAAADCTPDTALQVMRTPVAMPMECAMRAQVMAAGGLAENLAEGHYLKVRCERRRDAARDASAVPATPQQTTP
jgi:hypothetical protein